MSQEVWRKVLSPNLEHLENPYEIKKKLDEIREK